MEKKACKNCFSTLELNDSICLNCYFPNTEDVQVESAFRMKMVDVKYWFHDLDRTRNFFRIAAIIFIAIGGSIAFALKGSFFLGGLGFLTIGLIYLALYIWSNIDQYFPYLVAAIFYFVHTFLELLFNLSPFNIISLGLETGIISKFTMLFSLLRYIYPVLRIALGGVFIKGLMSANKIKKNEKFVKSYCLSQSINKGKMILETSPDSMASMFLKNYMNK